MRSASSRYCVPTGIRDRGGDRLSSRAMGCSRHPRATRHGRTLDIAKVRRQSGRDLRQSMVHFTARPRSCRAQ